jgi:hypothetical protein
MTQLQKYFKRQLRDFQKVDVSYSGFGLQVAYWPLETNFAGSNPAEAVGFFRAKKKILSTPSFRKGSKAVGPMS